MDDPGIGYRLDGCSDVLTTAFALYDVVVKTVIGSMEGGCHIDHYRRTKGEYIWKTSTFDRPQI